MHQPTAFVSNFDERSLSSAYTGMSYNHVSVPTNQHQTSTARPMTSQLVAAFAGDVFTATTTGGMGDAIAQYAESKGQKQAMTTSPFQSKFRRQTNNRFNFDTRRTLAYAVMSGVYSGAFQHFWFPALQRLIQDPMARLAINQGLMIPLLYYPLLIWLVPKLRAKSKVERKQLRDTINVRKTVPTNWAFWVPLQFIQFQFIPDAYYVTYCSFCGLVWKIVLSLMTAGGCKKGKVKK